MSCHYNLCSRIAFVLPLRGAGFSVAAGTTNVCTGRAALCSVRPFDLSSPDGTSVQGRETMPDGVETRIAVVTDSDGQPTMMAHCTAPFGCL
jgi:hypothetical protein